MSITIILIVQSNVTYHMVAKCVVIPALFLMCYGLVNLDHGKAPLCSIKKEVNVII